MMNGNKNGFRNQDSAFWIEYRTTQFVSELRTLKLESLLILFFLLLLPSAVYAQGAAPALFGVREIVIQYAHFLYPQASNSCGLVRDNLADELNKVLQGANLPAVSTAIAKPPQIGVARIDLLPEVVSTNSEGLDCTSWVSLTAQSQSNVKVQPVDVLRNVTIGYWHEGTMIASGQSVHAHLVTETLQKMATEFAEQYKLDQRPQ